MSENKYSMPVPASEAEEALQYYERQKAQEKINHPDYYNAGGIEAIDFIEANGFNFNLGNVIKYIVRAGLKDGEVTLEALKKAQWYFDREITRMKNEENKHNV